MPESPRWLAQRDNHEKALQALAQLHSNGDVNDPFVQAELVEIESKIKWEREHPPPNYIEMLIGRDRRRTWLGIGVVSLSPGRFRVLSDNFAAILPTSYGCECVSCPPSLSPSMQSHNR